MGDGDDGRRDGWMVEDGWIVGWMDGWMVDDGWWDGRVSEGDG